MSLLGNRSPRPAGHRLAAPELTRAPLGFFAEQLRTSLLVGGTGEEAEHDVYAIRSVIERITSAKTTLEQLPAPAKPEADLEPLRDALRRSDHRAAVRMAGALPLEALSESQLQEVLLAMSAAGPALNDNSPEELASYDLVVSIGERLGARPEDTRLAQRIGIALVRKGVTLYSLDRSEEEIGVYDEVVRRFGAGGGARGAGARGQGDRAPEQPQPAARRA